MRISALPLLALLSSAAAAAKWSFGSAKLEIAGTLHQFDPASPVLLAHLSTEDNFKVLLTTKEDDLAKKPHQAMLLIKDEGSELEANLVIPVRANGRGSLTISYKDLGDTLTRSRSIALTLVIGGFGETVPLLKHIATLSLDPAPSSVVSTAATGRKGETATQPLRYAAMPEITHTFKSPDPMPPSSISFLFSAILLLCLFGLFAAWIAIGVNVSAWSEAVSSSPIGYLCFLVSLVGIEGALFMYWSHLKIMAALGAVMGLSVPLFFSGRFALREVAGRRKAGSR